MERVGLSESRIGSPNPRPKRARKELTREQIEVVEPSHKNSRTKHLDPFRMFSRRELFILKEEYQVQDELDLLLDPEADRYIASPFVLDIENYLLPTKFKIPSMKSYEATTDPEDHLFAFLTQMRLQTAADEIRCKTFPMFLERRHVSGSRGCLLGPFDHLASSRGYSPLSSFRREPFPKALLT